MDLNNEIAAVIFDCDGVLVDSEPIANRLFHRCLVGLGLALTADQTNERFMGRSMPDCIAAVEAILGRAVAPQVWTELARQTEQAFDAELKAVSGVRTVLNTLKLPHCVASSGSHAKIRHSLAITHLDGFFNVICSADDVVPGKPAPDLFLHAAHCLGVTPARCAVIEDSRPGAIGAAAAGMQVLGYCERTTRAELEPICAHTFAHMSELPDLLGTA